MNTRQQYTLETYSQHCVEYKPPAVGGFNLLITEGSHEPTEFILRITWFGELYNPLRAVTWSFPSLPFPCGKFGEQMINRVAVAVSRARAKGVNILPPWLPACEILRPPPIVHNGGKSLCRCTLTIADCSQWRRS